MDDMNAFERQVAARFQQYAGPARPVDDDAIFAAISTSPSPRWTLRSVFTATKLAFAAVVLTLFGVVLVAGLVRQPTEHQAPAVGASASAPAESTDEATDEAKLLAGVDLVTEAVEPGVLRVVSDGHRAFEREIEPYDGPRGPSGYFPELEEAMSHRVLAGLDGSVWLVSGDGLVRLGDPKRHDWSEEPGFSKRIEEVDMEVGPDGHFWQVGRSEGDSWLRSYDGDRWDTLKQLRRTPDSPSEDGRVLSVEVDPTGSVWSQWLTEDGDRVVARRDGDSWDTIEVNDLGVMPSDDPTRLTVGADGDVWLAVNWLQRESDGAFVHIAEPAKGGTAQFDAGPDGTAWMLLFRGSGPGPADGRLLAFYDGEAWTEFDGSDGIPQPSFDHFLGYRGIFEVGPDGSVWFDPADPEHLLECNGIANFDGLDVRHYLQDHCFYGGDIAPDGTAWILAGEFGRRGTADGILPAGPVNLYAIPPGDR